jgi:hyperosmotically inducible protein
MKKLTALLLGGFLMVGAVACSDAKTSSNAPNTANDQAKAPDTSTAQTNQNDATNTTRKKQLESDIRAHEQRNNTTGGDAKRSDGDLESEVRDKLEANLPASQLTVKAKDGAVAIAGTVPTQEQLGKIEPLAKQIKGVQNVDVKATVAPATPNKQKQ